MDIIDILYENKDMDYKEFNSRIITNIDKDKIVGVRVPTLRKIVKDINNSDRELFLNNIPHNYFEEDMIHGIMLNDYKDIDILLDRLDKFLIYIDNWATCDIISPKIFGKYPDKVYKYICRWINSDYEYKIRFGIVTLLRFYLDDNFNESILDMVSKINSNYFYVNMAISWFYSFALIKRYDITVRYFEEYKLDKWIHNKSIQKAIDSYRISDDRKNYLRSLKIN